MRCCLLDLRLSALLCAGFSLPGLAEQDGRSVLTYPALLETVLSAADAIGACPWRVKLAPRFSISKGASSFFSAISGFFRAKPYPKSQKIFSLREKGELFLFFRAEKSFFLASPTKPWC